MPSSGRDRPARVANVCAHVGNVAIVSKCDSKVWFRATQDINSVKQKATHTHTHIHTHRERERERERDVWMLLLRITAASFISAKVLKLMALPCAAHTQK